jgi:hypothetical protein
LKDRCLYSEFHESIKSHEMRKYYGQNDSENFRNCVRAWVHICFYFDLLYKYSKTEISKATDDRENE